MFWNHKDKTKNEINRPKAKGSTHKTRTRWKEWCGHFRKAMIFPAFSLFQSFLRFHRCISAGIWFSFLGFSLSSMNTDYSAHSQTLAPQNGKVGMQIFLLLLVLFPLLPIFWLFYCISQCRNRLLKKKINNLSFLHSW